MAGFFEELKRRNVVRVGIAYAVVGGLIIEVIDTIAPRLGMPDWVPTFVIIAVLIGLPIALVFSWAYQLTPEGVKKCEDVDQEVSVAASGGRRLDFIIIAALVVALGYFIWERQQSPVGETAENATRKVASIAVLAFADLSPQGDQEYFADGIAEELINRFVKVEGLRVVGRTSSFQFKGQNLDLPKIGQQLNVETILEGSVRTSGNRVRVTAQLINAADGFHLWSEIYDRDMTDIFAVQDEISAAIVDALMGHLADERPATAPSQHVNLEAYNLYLRGRHVIAQRTTADLQQAVGLFEKSIALDGNFSDAHSGLAKANALLLGWETDTTRFQKYATAAKRSANRALELDPQNAEAYAFIAYPALVFEWDLDEAKRTMLRAIELNPTNAEIANFAGDYYSFVGQLDLAIEWERTAIDLDPLQPVNYMDLNKVYWYLRDWESAAKAMEAALTLDPSVYEYYRDLMYDYHMLGRLDEIERVAALAVDAKNFKGIFENEYAFDMAFYRGQRQEALQLLEALRQQTEAGQYRPVELARRYLYMELPDEAARWLDQAVRKRDTWLVTQSFFFLPEDLPDHPAIQKALDQPQLAAIFETRRQNSAGMLKK